MDNAENLARFEQLLALKAVVRQGHTAALTALQAEFDRAIYQEARRQRPRMRKMNNTDRQLAMAVVEAPFRAWAEGMYGASKGRQEEIDEALKTLAGMLPIPAAETPVMFREVWKGDYNSQGFGAGRYAQAKAKSYVDDAEQYGVRAEVRRVDWDEPIKTRYETITLKSYQVWVYTTETGAEILRRKPMIPMREWVRKCWARGVNPRVYLPFLPHGYEEEAGLDFFGGDLKNGVPWSEAPERKEAK